MKRVAKKSINVWWGIPCKSAIPVFRAMNELPSWEVNFVALHDLSENRKRLGWEIPESGNMKVSILGDNWRSSIDRIIGGADALHIVNGIYHNERTRYLCRRILQADARFGVIMEAPSNLEHGIRRAVKSVLGPLLMPIRTQNVARRALFLASASGSRHSDFVRLGFQADRIFPFGYFPDFDYIERPSLQTQTLRILCVGYLEPFKGHETLLSALHILESREIALQCDITGFGSQEDSLRKLCDRYSLNGSVKFHGVVSAGRLRKLFKESTILVAPGIEEPWGIRINEALLSGLPVVVSDGVGAKELVQTSGAGEIFRAGDALSLANSLERVAIRMFNPMSENNLRSAELAPAARARLFRERITPGAAAAYLSEIVDYISRLDRKSGSSVIRPKALWLQQDWLEAGGHVSRSRNLGQVKR